MRTRTRRLLIATAGLLLASIAFALYVLASRGLIVVLENRSSRTLADLRFSYEDGVIEFPRLDPGRTARGQFLPRQSDAW